MRVTIASCFTLLVFSAMGCGQRVNVEASKDLKPGEIVAPIILEGPKADQKIKVEFSSSECPIDVHVIVGKDENAVMNELDKAAPKIDAKASAKQSKGSTLDATIPAGQDYGVYILNATKKTAVKVRVFTP